MRTVETTVYKYGELGEAAQARARQWYISSERETWEPQFDDVVTLLTQLGFDLDYHDVQLMSGKTRPEPTIHYSIGGSDDGASFEGKWYADRMDTGTMLDDRPTDQALKYINAALMTIRLSYPDTTCRVDTSAASSSVRINDVDRGMGDDDAEADDDVINVLTMAVQAIGRWIYEGFRDELDYRLSDENAIEGINANDYEFDEDGDVV
jgi:hypothetical protein